jgi:hypothetical protein
MEAWIDFNPEAAAGAGRPGPGGFPAPPQKKLRASAEKPITGCK